MVKWCHEWVYPGKNSCKVNGFIPVLLPGPGGGGTNFPHGFFISFGVVKVFCWSLFVSCVLPLGPGIQRTSFWYTLEACVHDVCFFVADLKNVLGLNPVSFWDHFCNQQAKIINIKWKSKINLQLTKWKSYTSSKKCSYLWAASFNNIYNNNLWWG